MMSWTNIALYLVGGALLIAVIVLGAAILLHLDAVWRVRITAMTVPMLAIGTTVSTLFSGRNLSGLVLVIPPLDTLGGNVLRLLTALVVGLAVAQVVGVMYERRTQPPGPGGALFLAFFAYFFTNSVLNGMFGTLPSFDNALLYPLALAAGLYVTRGIDTAVLARSAKAGVLLMLGMSLALALVLPDLVVQRHYLGWIPALEGRLWGVGGHANSIGPLALTYLMLAHVWPWRSRWARWFGLAIALSVLVLAQSKTTWLAGLVVVLVMAAYRVHGGGDRRFPAMLLSALVLLAGVCLAALFADRFADLAVAAGGSVFADLTTLTGRVGIWDVALEQWEDNPLFGYGLTIWNEQFRQRIAIPYAYSAHNQFLQSLSGAGLVGLLGLIGYFTMLVLCARSKARAQHGVAVAMVTFLFMRCMTEVPLDITGIFSGEFICHLILLQLLLSRDAGEAAAMGPQTAFHPHRHTAMPQVSRGW